MNSNESQTTSDAQSRCIIMTAQLIKVYFYLGLSYRGSAACKHHLLCKGVNDSR